MDNSAVFESLDKRELRTLYLILAGHPNKTIQRRLGLSARTVTRIRSSILAKTGFLSFIELSASCGEAIVAVGKEPCTTAAEPCRASPSTPALTKTAETAPDVPVDDETSWRLLCCDLHDGAAQYLSAAMMHLQSVEAQHEMPAEAKSHLHMVGALLNVALRDIRDIIAGRSPACFTQAGIVPALTRLVEEMADASGLEIELLETLGRKRLAPLLETAVYRILQECLNNAVQHSGSRRIRAESSRTARRCDWRYAIGAVALIPTPSMASIEVCGASGNAQIVGRKNLDRRPSPDGARLPR